MSEIGGSSGSSAPPRESVGDETRAKREAFIKNANGDAVGNNWVAPKADFGKFLGYKGASPTELTGDQPITGSRIIELALQKEAQDLGMGAAKHGNQYRNIAISWGRFNNEPGRERDMIKDGIDAIRQGSDKNSMEQKGARMTPANMLLEQTGRMQKESHNDNIKYLEMQYRFQEMGKQESVISNLMKTRHDNISRMIRGNGQG
jgi:hypothetical protein